MTDRNTLESSAGYAYWVSQDGSSKVVYSLSVANDIDAHVNDGFRSIPHGGVERGGFLFGTRNDGVPRIEAYQAIDCQHAFGPSFVLSERDLENMRSQLRAAVSDDQLAGLQPLGWFIGHTRSPFQLNDRELTWFNEFFPQPGALTLLVKPERFAATRFAVLLKDALGQVERDGSKSSFILPLSGQSSSKTPAPSIPAPSKATAPAAPVPPQVTEQPAEKETLTPAAPEATAIPPPSAPAQAPPTAPKAAAPSADELETWPGSMPLESMPRGNREGAPPLPSSSSPSKLPSSSPETELPRAPELEKTVPLPSSYKPGSPVTPDPGEKTAPLPISPFRKTAPNAPLAPQKTVPLPPARSSPAAGSPDIPKPLGGQVTRIRSLNPQPGPAPFSGETRPLSRASNEPAAQPGTRNASSPPPEKTDSKLTFPYATPVPARSRTLAKRKSTERFGLRSAAVLILAALLGCLAGYWAYLQLPSPVIPVSVREQSGQFLVQWPAEQTNNVDYAALQVNDGQWVTLTSEQKNAGRATITPPPVGDLKIDLLAKHWLRDSRGIVRYLRTSH